MAGWLVILALLAPGSATNFTLSQISACAAGESSYFPRIDARRTCPWPWWSSNDGTRPFWIHRPRLAGTREGAVYDCWPEGASVPASAHSIHRSGDGAGRARLARPCLSHADRPGESAVEYIAAPLGAPTPADI